MWSFRFPLRSAIAIFSAALCLVNAAALAADIEVTNTNDSGAGSLRAAITQANSSPGPHVITFTGAGSSGTITLASPLPIIAADVSINGPGASELTISGGNTTRVFFADSGNIEIRDLTLADGLAQGGHAGINPTGGAGGGGLGAGAAIYVNNTAAVTLADVEFADHQAAGGDGGNSGTSSGGGGGGGLGGNGGNTATQNGTGGGGLYGNGGNDPGTPPGSTGFGGTGGGGQYTDGGTSTGTNNGGGGGGGITTAGGNNGGAGGNGPNSPPPVGGAGGATNVSGGNGLDGGGGGGAGGGASSNATGGNGGRNGGGGGDAGVPVQGKGGDGGDHGGGGGGYNGTAGGNGGFGGGGGGGTLGGAGGTAGFGGGNGGASGIGGNGGSAYGGAIFVREGGTLVIENSSLASGNSVTAGAGGAGNTSGTAGSAAGAGIYLHGTTELVLGGSATGEIADQISGTGKLTKKGTGTQTLSGVNNYTGDTKIEAGILAVTGSITSNTTVEEDGTLQGTGVIFGNVHNHGVLAPGGSIGTLGIDGDYDASSSATLEIEINDGGNTPGTNNDLLTVSGTATLDGGKLHVVAESGNYVSGTTFHYLRSDNEIQGSFNEVETSNLGLFKVTLGYNDYFDGYYWNYFRLFASYTPYALTYNQRQVAKYLDREAIGASGDFQDVLDGLNSLSNDPAAVRWALDSMNGQIGPTMASLGLQNTTIVMQLLAGQLRAGSHLGGGGGVGGIAVNGPSLDRDSPIILVSYDNPSSQPQLVFVSQGDPHRWHGWSFGYGLGGAASTDGNAAGLNYGMGGVLLGAEQYFERTGRVGFFGGYQGTSVRLDGPFQQGRINGGMFGGYLYNDDGFNYYSAITGMQFNGFETERAIQFDGIDRLASANFSGWQGYGYLERGVNFRRESVTLQPFAAMQYIYLRQNSYQESGADSLDLFAGGIDANSLRGIVGSRLQFERGYASGRLLPELRALWLHEFLDAYAVVNSFFGPVGGSSFAIRGLDLGRDWAIIGGGVRYELPSGWQLYANYDAQVNSQQVFHVGSGGMCYSW